MTLAISASIVLNALRVSHTGEYAKWKHVDTIMVLPGQQAAIFPFAFSYAGTRRFRTLALSRWCRFWSELMFLAFWATVFAWGVVLVLGIIALK